MKKLFFVLIFIKCLFSSSIEYYLYSIDMNYKEYDTNGAYLDGDYSDLGDLNGIGIKLYSNNLNYRYYLKGEFAYGSSTYVGYTWGGDYLVLYKNDVYMINLQSALFPGRKNYYLGLGARIWNRGKSDYPGDYNEIYYWPYVTLGYYNVFNLNLFYLSTEFAYQYAFLPKLKADFGSGTTLSLGTTTGYKVEIKTYFKYSSNLIFNLMYRYQMWHINRSDPAIVTYNNKQVIVIEPESYTKNQYIGAGLIYKF